MELNAVYILQAIVHWLIWTIAALIATFSVWYLYWKTTRDKRLIDKIPGYKDWPLVGDLPFLSTNPEEFLRRQMALLENARENGIFKLKILEMPWILLLNAASAEKLLTSTKHLSKPPEYDPLHPWLGMGLLTSTGEAWRARRHVLTSSFHFSILQDFLEVINEHALKLVKKLNDEHCDTGQPFDIFEPITLNTLDIICCTAMGVDVGALDNGKSDYVQALHTIKEEADMRPRKPLNNIDLIYNNTAAGRRSNRAIDLVHQFTHKVISQRKEIKRGKHDLPVAKRRPFLDLLLDCQDEQGNHLTNREIQEEVDTFMFEGHDTTASGISFAIHLLGANVDVQRKCQAEVDNVLGSSTSFCSSDLSKMTYLERSIKEALRIFPPVPYYGRVLVHEEKFGDYLVPKGTSVYIPAMSLHRDPVVFPDPEKYDPMRFTPEECVKRNPFAYLPFSAGPRNCIGQKFAMMELKVIIATLLRNFNIESVQKREELRIRPSLVIQPCDGIKVKLTSRTNLLCNTAPLFPGI